MVLDLLTMVSLYYLILVTLTTQLNVLLLTTAVTVAVPALLPITSPEEETVHTLGLLLRHVIASVAPITSKVYLSYCSSVMFDLLIASECTVQLASTLLLLLITNTSAVPGPTVVITPF